MPMTLRNPYPEQWKHALKGNLHTHTTNSDGRSTIQEAIDAYAANDYGFLMISDHDKSNDLGLVDNRGLVLIPGVEVSAGGPHMLQVGTAAAVTPDADRQKVIDAVAKEGGFTIANHPNWEGHFNHFPQEQLEKLTGYAGVEIWNGCIKRLEGMPLATDRWDRLLTKGRKLWGHGVDDAHRADDFFNGWDVVWVQEKTVEAVVEALRNGSFYASSGVTITDVKVDGDTLHVTSRDAEKMVVVTDGGRVVMEKWGTEIFYKLTPDIETYIRVQCYGRGDYMAWTQPFFVEGNPLGQTTLEADVPLVEKGPKIKGNLSDPKWKKATSMMGFIDISKALPAASTSTVYLIADEEKLYLGFKFDEPYLEKLVLKGQPGEMMKLYTDDSAEIFLDTEGKGVTYYHIIVNAAGTWGAAIGVDKPWMPKLEAASGRSKTGWTVEVAIPHSELSVTKLKDGMVWGVNLARNRIAGERSTSSWAWVGKSFHRPWRFGKLRFRKM
jgi:hypothetical protein